MTIDNLLPTPIKTEMKAAKTYLMKLNFVKLIPKLQKDSKNLKLSADITLNIRKWSCIPDVNVKEMEAQSKQIQL